MTPLAIPLPQNDKTVATRRAYIVSAGNARLTPHQHQSAHACYARQDGAGVRVSQPRRGHPTIGAAVDAPVVEIPGLDRAWAGLNAEELEEIRDVLMSYLFLTRGTEWT